MISEKEICEEFGVSRTPYREAIEKLKEIKLVDVVPRFGTFVSEVNIDEIRCANEVRIKLETFACEIAAKKRTSVQLDQLEKLAEEGEKLLETFDFDVGGELDRQFHRIIAEATQNSILDETLSRLRNISARVWTSSFRKRLSVAEIVTHWKNIYLAIKDGDSEKAARIMGEHIQYSIDHLKNELLP